MKIKELNNKNMKASVLIINYNNKKFIQRCLNSVMCQTYKNFEVIFFDDNSSDSSLDELKKFKNIKVIHNKKNGKHGSFNQINGYQKAFKKSNGDIIFFLDSDDYFFKNKLSIIMNKFKNNNSLDIIFDLPVIHKKNGKVKKKIPFEIIKNYWPYFPPQSCISIRRSLMSKIFSSVNFKIYPDIWLDFRIAIFAKYIANKFFVFNKNLTCYYQSNNSESSKFKFLGKTWWFRRKQAHNYIKFFFKNNSICYKKNFDYYLTYAVNFCIK
jgi:glycosyltransferase involved in cell wall biosynthesis